MNAPKLILASGSLIRQTLLTNAGLSVAVIKADIDERALESALPDDDKTPQAIAMRLAVEKAKSVSEQNPGSWVIGCDQTMALESKLFHKSKSIDEARDNLCLLRGQTHHLHSAVALVQNGRAVWTHLSSAALTMRNFSDAFLEAYLLNNGSSVLSSVGCYQLEGEGIQLFSSIEGDYFTILGLPLLPLLDQLRKMGINHE